MTDQFTEEQLTDFKEAFSLFDKDGDGTITSKELETVLSCVGQGLHKEDNLEEIITSTGADANNPIDFQTFLAILTMKSKEVGTEKSIELAFLTFDKDDTGTVDAEHLTEVLTTLGDKMTEEEVKEVIGDLEAVEGRIDYKSLVPQMAWNSSSPT